MAGECGRPAFRRQRLPSLILAECEKVTLAGRDEELRMRVGSQACLMVSSIGPRPQAPPRMVRLMQSPSTQLTMRLLSVIPKAYMPGHKEGSKVPKDPQRT